HPPLRERDAALEGRLLGVHRQRYLAITDEPRRRLEQLVARPDGVAQPEAEADARRVPSADELFDLGDELRRGPVGQLYTKRRLDHRRELGLGHRVDDARVQLARVRDVRKVADVDEHPSADADRLVATRYAVDIRAATGTVVVVDERRTARAEVLEPGHERAGAVVVGGRRRQIPARHVHEIPLELERGAQATELRPIGAVDMGVDEAGKRRDEAHGCHAEGSRSIVFAVGRPKPSFSYSACASLVCSSHFRSAYGPSSTVKRTSSTPRPCPRNSGRRYTSARYANATPSVAVRVKPICLPSR